MFYFYLLAVIFSNLVKCCPERGEGAYCKYGEETKDDDKPHFRRQVLQFTTQSFFLSVSPILNAF